MGFLKLILNANNAEGVREAMRMSFDKHANAVASTEQRDRVYAGLVGALASRRMLQGRTFAETAIAADIIPFVCLDEAAAKDAVAELAVHSERPHECDCTALKAAIEKGITLMIDQMPEGAAIALVARSQRKQWTILGRDIDWTPIESWAEHHLRDEG